MKKVLRARPLEWISYVLLVLCGLFIGVIVTAGQAEESHFFNWDWPSPLPETQTLEKKVVIYVSPPPTIIGVALFANGSAVIRNDDVRRLSILSAGLMSCKVNDIVVYGVTSSVEYRRNSRGTNYRLAHDRAKSVADFMVNLGVHARVSPTLTSEPDLAVARRLSDRLDGAPDETVAAMARRVDISLSDLGKCTLKRGSAN